MSEAQKIRLNIVTPCNRPVYLPIMACQLRSFTKLSVHWLIGYENGVNQATPTGFRFGHDFQAMFTNVFPSGPDITTWTRNPASPSEKGTAQRNEALQRITNGEEWVAFLDDDTILPPDYEDTVISTIRENPDADGFIFQQRDKRGDLRMDVMPEICRSYVRHLYDYSGHNGEDGCDTGQMLFKRKLIGDAQWIPRMAADRTFYNNVVHDSCQQSRVRWVKKVGSIYNVLR